MNGNFQPQEEQDTKEATEHRVWARSLGPSHAASEGLPSQVHFTLPWTRSCPERSIPVLPIAKKQPNPVCQEGGHTYHTVFAEGFQLDGLQTNPGLSPWPRRAGRVHDVWSAPGAQVLNIRKPPNAVPGGLLFITDPCVSSNHTLSPLCSSAMAKEEAMLPHLRSSVVWTGVRW